MSRNMEYVKVLIEFAKLLKPKVYVELGIWKGWTITQMAPYCEKVIGVDIDKRCEFDIKNSELHWMSTVDYASKLKADGVGEFIDMLFIDACHEKKNVLEDFNLFLNHVKTTGVIFMHDTHPANEKLTSSRFCWNAWEAVDELYHVSVERNFEIMTMPGPSSGLSIARRRGPHHLAWMK